MTSKTLAKEQQELKLELATRKALAERRLREIYQRKSSYWKKIRDEKALMLFHACARQVPAYRDFLKKARIQPDKIKTFTDFQTVLPVNKENYLRSYPLEKLCLSGTLASQSLVLTSTSGSTGTPFYFPRNGVLDSQSSLYHQLFLRNSKLDINKSTLVLVCFGMGVWIGGVITYEAFKTISERGYPLTILTPGVNKREIFEAMKNIAPKYDQVILCGYPPFMKDVIDEGKANGVNWHKFHLRMIFAAESFSENFRDYLVRKTGIKNVYRDTMNIYGSADLGTMAEETPLCILVRRLALKHPRLYAKIFKEANRLPTLAQFHPGFIDFECVNKSIYCTGDNILPLIRYEIGDNGGVIEFSELEQIFAGEGINLRAEAKRVGILDTLAELPFIYIYERSDLSTKLYGAIIFPEYIKGGLHGKELEESITGKFTMFTKHDAKQNEYLEINLELKPGKEAAEWLEKTVSRSIITSLKERSAEYKNNADLMPGRVEPRIIFWPHEHPTHFQTGIKQKWVKKH